MATRIPSSDDIGEAVVLRRDAVWCDARIELAIDDPSHTCTLSYFSATAGLTFLEGVPHSSIAGSSGSFWMWPDEALILMRALNA